MTSRAPDEPAAPSARFPSRRCALVGANAPVTFTRAKLRAVTLDEAPASPARVRPVATLPTDGLVALRPWAIETALDCRGDGEAVAREDVLEAAADFEAFVLGGPDN